MRDNLLNWGLAVSCVGLLLILPLFMHLFQASRWELAAHIGFKIFLNISFGLCLWIMLQAGELSLGQGAFITIGAYTTGILIAKFRIIESIWLGCLTGAFVSATIAFILGLIIVHLRRIFFLLVTWAFAEMFRPVLISFQDFFGGAGGIVGIPPPTGLYLFPELYTRFYYWALLFTILVFLVVWRVSHSKIGLIYRGIGQNDVLTNFCGIHVRRYRLQVFALGCFFTGFGGGVMASYLSAISPDTFTFFTSLDIIMFNLIGGIGCIAGPIIGAIVLTGVNEVLFGVGYYKMILYGLIVILIIRFLPGGIVSVPAAVKSKIRRQRKNSGG